MTGICVPVMYAAEQVSQERVILIVNSVHNVRIQPLFKHPIWTQSLSPILWQNYNEQLIDTKPSCRAALHSQAR